MWNVDSERLCTAFDCGRPAEGETGDEAEVSPHATQHPAQSGAQFADPRLESEGGQITSFLIDTLPIRNLYNSLKTKKRCTF
jgi:hypothetical protein